MPGLAIIRLLALTLLIGTAAPVLAQEPAIVASPVVTVDQEALFARSAFGQRIQAEIEADSAALAAENRALETELSDEERRLTDLRPTTDPAEFRRMAAEFDARVVDVRRRQDQKGRDLARRQEEARQEFFRAALPILAELVRERGAVAILDSRAVILSADAIDITDEAIRRIDEVLGDGSDPAATETPGQGEAAVPTNP